MTRSGELLPAEIPLCPTPAGLADLDVYLDILQKWNRTLNLTGARTPVKIINELICDSFYLAKFLYVLFDRNANANAITLDLGAGAGLPGIPLRIVWDKGFYVMIEAREKRALFLANVLSRLNLARTSVYRGRAEAYFREHTQQYTCILSRAFMPWQELISFCGPYLSADGYLIIMASTPPPPAQISWSVVYSLAYANNKRWLWAVKLYEH